MEKDIRWIQRLQNLNKAFAQLRVACELPDLSELERAGLIQTYEFTFELAWKTMKDWLSYNGVMVTTPRETIKSAFSSQLINDPDTWLEALNARNELAHSYDEQVVMDAATKIRERYFSLIEHCVDSFNNLASSANDGLRPRYREIVTGALESCSKVQRAILFGSRAMGNFRPASDIDLAIMGGQLGLDDVLKLQSAIAEQTLPIEVDFIVHDSITNDALLEHICKHGIVWWER